MKTLPQIAFDFATDKNTDQKEQGESSSPAQPLQNEQAPGVGVRLKHTRKEMESTQKGSASAENGKPDPEPGAEAVEKTEAPGQQVIEATFLEISSSGKGGGEDIVTGKAVKSTRGRKSLKQVSAEADLIEIPGDEELFSKQYYTMGEVAAMFRVNQSLLRFWEAEFDILKPRKNKKGDRHFRPVDIKNLHLIYNLLRQRKYTIEGAKEFLKNSKKAEARFEAIQRLQEIRSFLLELKAQV